MMQILKKYRVRINFTNMNSYQTFCYHDNFMSNVLRKLADIEFDQTIESINIIEEHPVTSTMASTILSTPITK